MEGGNFLPPAMRISRRPPLLESRCPFRCAALRSKKNRCAVCSDTTNTTQLSALPGSFSPRTAGWLTKQAGSQSNATQRKQRTATQKPWSCRELRRRKIEERFGCRTHLVNELHLPCVLQKTTHRNQICGCCSYYTRHRSEKLSCYKNLLFSTHPPPNVRLITSKLTFPRGWLNLYTRYQEK